MVRVMEMNSPYHLAQRAIADLKASVYTLLESHPEGLTNAQVGRLLGIYAGHEGHEGHISRVLLGMLKGEGVAEQEEPSLRWRLRLHGNASDGR
jgi:hypothetical protein